MKIEIRKMQSEDILNITNIEKNVFSAPWNEETFTTVLEKYSSFVLLCNSELIGYLIIIVQDYLAYIANFAIKKSYQKQGFGTYFLSFAILEAKKLQCSILYLDVRISNKNAIKLYKKVGFSTFNRTQNFYKNPLEDALQMGLKIG